MPGFCTERGQSASARPAGRRRPVPRKSSALLAASVAALGGAPRASALIASSIAHSRGGGQLDARQILGSQGSEALLLRGWVDHVRSLPAHLQDDVAAAAGTFSEGYRFETKFFSQRVDHINKYNSAVFAHRYFVYTKFSELEHEFPTFVFCGAEQGDVYREWDRLGFMLEVARQHGAKIVYLEHRFFGKSMPFGNEAFQGRPDRVGLLSLEQSMADYEAIIRAERGTGPVLTYGGSLSGTIAAMMRINYPSLIDIAFASSAPVLGVVGVADQFAWRKRMTDNFAELGGADCPDLVRRAFGAFMRRDGDKLRSAFQPCEQTVTEEQWQAVVQIAWQELERLGSFSYPPSKSGIPLACEEMRAKDLASDEELFAKMLHLGPGGRLPQGCLNMTQLTLPPSAEQIATSWATGWSYMACTEVIHPIGANGITDMFPAYNWTVETLAAGCEHSWGVRPDADYLRRKMDFDVERPGAYPTVRPSQDIPGRILFTYGTRDPWSTMVPSKGWADDVEIVRIEGGSHCSDLETAREEDTEDMKAGRRRIAEVLGAWLGELRPVRRLRLRGFGTGHASPLALNTTGKSADRPG